MRFDWLMEDSFNALEAVFWMALAFVFMAKSRSAHPQRRPFRITAMLLGLFAITDIVEIRTGAWWSPWWLLLWKALCVLGLLGCAGHARRRHRRATEMKK